MKKRRAHMAVPVDGVVHHHGRHVLDGSVHVPVQGAQLEEAASSGRGGVAPGAEHGAGGLGQLRKHVQAADQRLGHTATGGPALDLFLEAGGGVGLWGRVRGSEKREKKKGRRRGKRTEREEKGKKKKGSRSRGTEGATEKRESSVKERGKDTKLVISAVKSRAASRPKFCAEGGCTE